MHCRSLHVIEGSLTLAQPQEYWAARAERSTQMQERMAHSFYPADGDVSAAKQRMYSDVQQHAKAVADAEAARYHNAIAASHPGVVLVHSLIMHGVSEPCWC